MNQLLPAPAWRAWHSEDLPIELGASSCLLGDLVRFDGGHARDRFVSDVLGGWVQWRKVCPELESGMTIPRPTIRLVKEEDGLHLVAPSTGEDWTDAMQGFSKDRIEALGELDGFVLKKNSPSCGLERIKIYLPNGHALNKDGVGMFAAALMERWPLLPVEEDGRLNDPRLRENFIERVFCRNRWRLLVQQGLSRKKLVEFHTAHKLIARAHDETGYQKLGKLVGSLGQRPDEEVFAEYEALFHRVLKKLATTKLHTNVLQHAVGYLKEHLDAREKIEVHSAIEDFRKGLLPLIVPVTLLRFTIVKYNVDYLKGQLYFEPHPKELMLRNHV